MAASAVERPCQEPIVGREKHSNLIPAERGYLIGSDTEGDHSLSVPFLARGSAFVAPPVIVNLEKDWMVVNEPDSRK